ncbi:FAD-dependent monooxygenase [Paenibacillus methanolicus]|nr:FAD-dependent monooxygenase [Paenibacillus methanolicus]
MTRPWLIAGGGISGLSAAIALQTCDLPFALFERFPEAKPAGAGIILAPNALEALRRLHPDLKERAIELGRAFSEMRILSDRGDVLSRMHGGQYGSSAALTRTDLHRLLTDALPSEALHLGKKAVGVKQCVLAEEQNPILMLEDGSEREGEAIIACDGIHSLLRQQITSPAPLRYAGYTCWRGIASIEIHQPYLSETWGARGRFGVVPLKNGRAYWYALTNAAPGDERASAMDAAGLLDHFANFHDPIPQILRQAQHHPLIHADIADRKPLEQLAYGRIAFMGDAAHAMTPNLGQGACQALEDAAVLASCIQRGNSPQDAFRAYEKLRISRVRRMVADSFRMGKIAQLEQPILCRIRNTVMKLIPDAMNNRQVQQLYRI